MSEEMIIRPQLEGEQGQPVRRRAVAQREGRAAQAERRRLLAVMRAAGISARALAARKLYQLGAAAVASPFATRSVGLRVARSATVLGLLMEGSIMLSRGLRRLEGDSGRLVDAEDAETIWGDVDERATAAASTRARIEANPALLRIIGQAGRANDQISTLYDSLHRHELRRARGAELIDRSASLDAPESLADRGVAKLREAATSLRADADRAIASWRGAIGR